MIHMPVVMVKSIKSTFHTCIQNSSVYTSDNIFNFCTFQNWAHPSFLMNGHDVRNTMSKLTQEMMHSKVLVEMKRKFQIRRKKA